MSGLQDVLLDDGGARAPKAAAAAAAAGGGMTLALALAAGLSSLSAGGFGYGIGAPNIAGQRVGGQAAIIRDG